MASRPLPADPRIDEENNVRHTVPATMSEASEEKGKENTSLSDDARFSWLFFSPMVAVNVHTDVSNHGLG